MTGGCYKEVCLPWKEQRGIRKTRSETDREKRGIAVENVFV